MPSSFVVKINMVDISMFTGDLVEFVVDSHVFLPSMFTLLIRDFSNPVGGLLTYTDNQALIRIGNPVKISAKVWGSDSPVPTSGTLIDGEITSIEPVYTEQGDVLLRVRGFDLGHRLTMGKKTRTYGDGNPMAATMNDMLIVSKIATSNQLIPKVDMSGLSSLRYHYVMQYNQSDWDFLWSRAQLLGYQVYVDGRVLHFQKASKPRSVKPVVLFWGNNLQRFEPRIVSMGQVNAASAYGWDPKGKKTIKSKSKLLSPLDKPAIPGAVLGGSKTITTGFFMTKTEDNIMSPVIRDAGVAKVYANSLFTEHETQLVRASGTAEGHPHLLAGSKASVANVGVRFTGSYYITEAKHIYRDGQYSVKFEVTGRDPYTIRQLILGNDHSFSRIDGVVIGVVTDLNDMEKLGRVKVKYPWMPPDGSSEVSSTWARLASPGAGKDRGIFFTPEIGDEVLIVFEHGDVNYPYVVGALWNKKDKPPIGQGPVLEGGGKKTGQRIMRSRSGHVIILDDTKGKEKIIIEDKSKKNSIVFDSKAKSVTIKAEGDMTLEAGGKFIMKSTKDFTLDSKAKIAFKATNKLEMEGTAGALIKSGASQLDLSAAAAALKGTKVDIQGTAQTAIQGAQTSIKGSAMVEIQGALVKIN